MVLPKTLRPGYEQNVYFPMVTGDSIGSSQIQLANIYDMQGNTLLINEYVVLDASYVFQRFQSSIYLLVGSYRLIHMVSVLVTFFQKTARWLQLSAKTY